MKIVRHWSLCLASLGAMALSGCGGREAARDIPTPAGFAPKMEDASSFAPPGAAAADINPESAAAAAAANSGTPAPAPGTATPGAAPATATPGTK